MEECALARPTGAHNHRKLPLWYVERDPGQGGDLVFSLLIDLSDVEQAYHVVRVFNQIMARGNEESRRFPLEEIFTFQGKGRNLEFGGGPFGLMGYLDLSQIRLDSVGK